MEALHDVVKLGWVRYIGMSSCWAWQFQLMQREFPSYSRVVFQVPSCYASPNHTSRTNVSLEYALNNRLTPFISMQNQHSAMYREEEREMMPMLKHFGVGVIPWGPIAAGRTSSPPFSLRIRHRCNLTQTNSPLPTLQRDGFDHSRSRSDERRSWRTGEACFPNQLTDLLQTLMHPPKPAFRQADH